MMTLQVDGTISGISGNNTAGGAAYIADGGWPQIPPLPSYGNSRDGPYLQYQALIYATGLHGIRILGSGTIDGQGDWWWANQRNRSLVRSGRPNLLQIVNSSDVEVAGVTLRDSPFWCLHTVYCTNVWVHHATVRSRMYAPNSDGIDPGEPRHSSPRPCCCVLPALTLTACAWLSASLPLTCVLFARWSQTRARM
jgi:hypothetical protein